MNPFGAVLGNDQPNPLEFGERLRQQRLQEQRYNQQQAQSDQRYNQGLLSDFAGELNKHAYSGTPLDPVFQQNTTSILKTAAEKIKKGDYTGATMDVANGAGELSAYAMKAKAISDRTSEAAKAFAKDPSVNWTKLRDLSLVAAFHNPDGSLKDPTHLMEDDDYVGQTLEKAPEQVTNGLGSLQNSIEKGKYLPYKADLSRNIGGMDRDLTYEGKYDPLYNELVDEKGAPVDAASGKATGVRVRGEDLTLNGNKVKGVSDDVRNYFYGDPGTKAAVRAEAKRLMQHLPSDTRQEDVERYILHKELSNSANSYINKTKDKVSDAALQRQAASLQHAETMAAIHAANKTNNGSGGSSAPASAINDTFGRIAEKAVNERLKQGTYLQANILPSDEQAAVLETVKKVTGLSNIGNKNIYLDADKQGNVGVYWADDVTDKNGNLLTKKDQLITPLTEALNLKTQPSVKEKRTVVQRILGTGKKQDQPSSPASTTFKNVPKGGF